MLFPPDPYSDHLNVENQLPFYDGQITPWVSDFARQSPGYLNRVVLYCNGVGTPATGHRMECFEVSTACECKVLGVYNQSGFGNFPGKEWVTQQLEAAVIECGGWTSPVGAALAWGAATSNSGLGWARWVIDGVWQATQDTGVNFVQAIAGKLWGIPFVTEDHRRIVVRNLLYYNHAVLSYFDLLDSRWDQRPIYAVSYSQGNWVLANALGGLRAVRRGPDSLPSNICVFGLAPPNFFWPPGVQLRLYANNNDLIPILSLGAGRTGDTTSWSDGTFNPAYWHSQEQYVQTSQFVRDLRSLLGLDIVVNFPQPVDDGTDASNVRNPGPQPTTRVTREHATVAPPTDSVDFHQYGGQPVDPRDLVPKPGKPSLRR